ncbi:LysR substrate-binding domain-containing protein [Jeongeupia chitinilytica]|uniref:LysR family transcriptional regulator n=1 Tax=Jeongeupia chitinilytica TaxID=1041641 RepID=A0ABQ3H571_9NEIS|nr:LysR substrate-binding domain-containing protein [Jeongeupia chitinilytica]GHD67967.1 LysR family transcriptional regulator [Jeongeupia chitinilytica]
MNLRQIEYAVAVAETEHFTRAAEACHTVQSALSHQIARLEDELGAPLFERTSRRVQLTPAGRAFLPAARQLLHDAQRVRDEVAAATGQIRGSLAVSVISALNAPDAVALLAEFHRRHPQVDIRLNSGMSEVMLADVREYRADAAFIGLWPGEEITGLNALQLCDEALVAVLPLAHALASRPRLDLQDIAGEHWVDYRAGSSARRQTDEAFARAGLARHVGFEIDHIALLERFVRQGLAIGMVPASSAAGLSGVCVVPVRDAPARRVYCIWARQPTPAAQAFVELVAGATREETQ